ncbi:hypothetical protein O6H91_17G086700 [Diphasiastrum complanatum]|uniref:Uncharacterized protein n=1 Tax=Diphasiastrum complanatum TaxID=34168 RepID=A0ACC2B8Y0_DIPCM|nr:hypothetical protein O6H91_17G086700 [Diphasiastrum complanatum]
MEPYWARILSLLLSVLLHLHGCCYADTWAAMPVHGTGKLQPEDGICAALVTPYGYSCEEHTVTTTDGYILSVYRILHGVNGNSQSLGSPVFLQHGLCGAGYQWLENSPQESLGFVLADEGFDVWVGNTRGTRWSSGHIQLSVNDKAYWNWTVDELMSYDLQAMLGLVHSTTGQKSYYIGHSQGSLIALGALAQGTITELVASLVLFAPVAYLNQSKSFFAKAGADLYFEKLFSIAGITEFNPTSGIGADFMDFVCARSDSLCKAFWGPNCCMNMTRVPFYLQFDPQPTSTKNIMHFSQLIRTGTFQKYDYGTSGNMVEYLQPYPPTYELSSISTEISLFILHGGLDQLADANDVQRLIGDLKCKVKTTFVESYGHSDFIVGMHAYEDVYQDVVSFLKSSN